MVWDDFQEHVSCILRRGGRRGLGNVLTPSHAFSADSFPSAMSFPMHPLTFSLKRFGFAAEHITADQAVHTPARILTQLFAFQFPTAGHVVPGTILDIWSTHYIFPNHVSVSLNERQKNEQCFGLLLRWLLAVLSIFPVCKKRDARLGISRIER